MTEDIVYKLQEIATAKKLIFPRSAMMEAVLEIKRLRKIISEFVQAEEEYQSACDCDDVVELKNSWKIAWNALIEEAKNHQQTI